MRVFSNLAISLDGKIADRREPSQALGTPLDRKTMDVIRRKADVVVFGAETLRASKRAVKIKGKSVPLLVNAIITRSGRIDPSIPFWNDEDVVRFVFTTEAGFEAALSSARDRAFVICAGKKEVDPRLVLERLKQSNLKNILVEGGGEIMALFLKGNYLQELYVTLTPWILGGRENPSLVGGPGLESWSRLLLHRMKRVKNEVYFHYKVRGAQHV